MGGWKPEEHRRACSLLSDQIRPNPTKSDQIRRSDSVGVASGRGPFMYLRNRTFVVTRKILVKKSNKIYSAEISCQLKFKTCLNYIKLYCTCQVFGEIRNWRQISVRQNSRFFELAENFVPAKVCANCEGPRNFKSCEGPEKPILFWPMDHVLHHLLWMTDLFYSEFTTLPKDGFAEQRVLSHFDKELFYQGRIGLFQGSVSNCSKGQYFDNKPSLIPNYFSKSLFLIIFFSS